MRKSIVTALAALATSVMLAAPAAAEEVQVVVPYADLDLTDATGSAKLDQRIDAAVKQVCAKPINIRDLKSMLSWEQCKTAARNSALDQVSVLEPYESMALASVF